MIPLLPAIVIIPILFSLPIFYFGDTHAKKIAIAASSISFVLAVIAGAIAITQGYGALTFSSAYIQQINAGFSFSLGQLTLLLFLMTAIVFFAATLVSDCFIKSSKSLYYIVLLLSEAGGLGVFASSNFFLLYIFWEISEVAMFFMIFVFGSNNRRYAAMKFIIYSVVASLMLLIGVIMLYVAVPVHTFNIQSIISQGSALSTNVQDMVFVLFLIAFMIKMPVFPFHGWLPDAHTEAPTTGSMILAGVLLKYGGYGLFLTFEIIRMSTSLAPYLAVLFGFSAIYAAFAAIKQTNLKRLIAYTSITDMGIVALGLGTFTLIGNYGAFYGMLSHGLAIAILFLVAGTLKEMYDSLDMRSISGVIRNYPQLAYFFIFGMITIIGFPITTGFITDILIFYGSVSAFGLYGIIPLVSILVMGGLLFLVIEKVMMPYVNVEPAGVFDRRVVLGCSILAAGVILFGVLPGVFI